jgi:hypothetical protein
MVKRSNEEPQPGEVTFDEEDRLREAGLLPVSVRDSLPALPEDGRRFIPQVVPSDFEDAVAQFGDELVVFEGSPYHPVDKRYLVGKPFIILGWTMQRDSASSYGQEFVSLMAVTQEGIPDKATGEVVNRIVINDGAVPGICQQVRELIVSGRMRPGMLCKNGLRVNTYQARDAAGNYLFNPDGSQLEGTTYYIN